MLLYPWDYYPYDAYGYPYDYYYGAPYDYYNYCDDSPYNSYDEFSYPGSSQGGHAVVARCNPSLQTLATTKAQLKEFLATKLKRPLRVTKRTMT